MAVVGHKLTYAAYIEDTLSNNSIVSDISENVLRIRSQLEQTIQQWGPGVQVFSYVSYVGLGLEGIQQ